MISASVAPLARFSSAITSAFLLARSVLGLLARFLHAPLSSRAWLSWRASPSATEPQAPMRSYPIRS